VSEDRSCSRVVSKKKRISLMKCYHWFKMGVVVEIRVVGKHVADGKQPSPDTDPPVEPSHVLVLTNAHLY
jgi:hypothetical protein